MAQNLTHFAVISPGSTSLRPGGDIDADLPFTLPANTADRRGVLTYKLDAVSPSNLRFSVGFNGGTPLFNRAVDSTVLHSEHEVVSGFHAGDNTLRIRVTGGTGTLVISDVVLFYDRLVEEL
jgi:hypothetical protein